MSRVIPYTDGGRIAGALSPYAGVAGLGLGGVIAYNGLVGNPIFYLILLSGGYETFQRFYNPNHMPPNYYKVSQAEEKEAFSGPTVSPYPCDIFPISTRLRESSELFSQRATLVLLPV